MVNFEFSTIRYEFEALNSFTTPYFLGSTFRGVFGRRLKKLVCIKPREDCRNCQFNRTCPYTVIFETEIFLNQPSKYVMRPPFEKRQLNQGDSIHLDITLLGESTNYWEFITQSFSKTINIGKDRLLKLKKIEFYHPFEEKYYPVKSFVPRFEAYSFFELRTGRDTLKLKVYPTSIKIKGEFIKASELDKDIFIKSVIQRVSTVALSYGLKTEKIFIDKNRFDIIPELKPSPMKRWSNRKKKHMIIPAFEGSITLKGELNQIFPYISLIEIINLGKSVSFGLGKMKIEG